MPIQKLILVWKSGDKIPFLISLIDEVTETEEGLTLIAEDDFVIIPNFSFYNLYTFESNQELERIVSMFASFKDNIESKEKQRQMHSCDIPGCTTCDYTAGL
jgi:hypothetical protein